MHHLLDVSFKICLRFAICLLLLFDSCYWSFVICLTLAICLLSFVCHLPFAICYLSLSFVLTLAICLCVAICLLSVCLFDHCDLPDICLAQELFHPELPVEFTHEDASRQIPPIQLASDFAAQRAMGRGALAGRHPLRGDRTDCSPGQAEIQVFPGSLQLSSIVARQGVFLDIVRLHRRLLQDGAGGNRTDELLLPRSGHAGLTCDA